MARATGRKKGRAGEQLGLGFRPHGGARKNAGRKRVAKRPCVEHRGRPSLDRGSPVHVTLRANRGVPSFRADLVAELARGVFREVSAAAISKAKAKARREAEGAVLEQAAPARPAPAERPERSAMRDRRWKRRRRATDRVADGFHVVHYSLQADHIHLIVEAADARALSCGMRRLVIRLAKRINEVVRRRRHGKIWGDRYHRHDLTSPREVRHALVYVLQNGRKHGCVGRNALDPLSTASTFNGWAAPVARTRDGPDGAEDTAPPSTWLLEVGWRRAGGALDPSETPRG